MSDDLKRVQMCDNLARLQAKLPTIPMDAIAKGAKFSYKYATLTKIFEVIRPLFAAHNFSIVQRVFDSETGKPCVETYIYWNGEFLSSGPLTLKVDQENMQALGSAITYAKRYQLCALLGIVADEDDDGNEASKPVSPPIEPPPKPKPSPAPETPVKPRNTAKGLIELQKVIQNLSLDVNHVRRASRALFGKDNSAGLSPEELGELTSFLKGDMRDQESFIMEIEKAVRL